MKLLFTNAGRRTYLIQYALELIDAGYPLQVCASDASEETAALHVDPRVRTFITPMISAGEEDYADCLLDICRREHIDLVIPLMDYELPVLSRRKRQFLAEGSRLWVSDARIIATCLDKQKCYTFCCGNDIRTPRSWFGVPEADARFPLIRKRLLGSGSVGQQILFSPDELPTTPDDEFFYQELIEGQEYGMDVLNDWNGQYVHSYFREKHLMRAGETDKARSLYRSEYEQVARTLSKRFGHVGNLDIDFMVTDAGELYFIDFNPRFGGGYPFTHHSGFNYLKALIDLSAGRQPVFPEVRRSITGMKGLALFHFKSSDTQRDNESAAKQADTAPDAPCEIMLSASGRRVALMCLMRSTAHDLGMAGRILATDVNRLNGTFHLADQASVVPKYDEPEACLQTLMALCCKHRVQLVVPTIDPDLPFYAKHHQAFEAIGTKVAVSSMETVLIANDKRLTHEWLVREGFPTVRQINAADLLKSQEGWRFPLFVKPRAGSSSIDARRVVVLPELQRLMADGDYIVQTIAPGREYTVDVYVDRAGRCRCAVPRLRIETRGGEVVKGMTARIPAIQEVAKRVAEALPGAWGVLNIQVFYDESSGAVNVIEINPRFGGGYPLTHAAGAPMTRWLLEETLGLPCTARDDQWTDGLVMLRYDEAVFVSRDQAGV